MAMVNLIVLIQMMFRTTMPVTSRTQVATLKWQLCLKNLVHGLTEVDFIFVFNLIVFFQFESDYV